VVYVDVFLQHVQVSELVIGTEVRHERSFEVRDCGFSNLLDGWVNLIADRFVQETRFDPLHTADSEQQLYNQVYEHVTLDAPVPDLVIYLQAPEDVLLKRIAKRGIRYERMIDATYLRNLSEAYARMFLNYEAAPVLIVNAEHINLVDNDKDYAALLEQIYVTRQGKHYFNPMSTVI
jgi:deoxyadenosine/deoxycytidine kinase